MSKSPWNFALRLRAVSTVLLLLPAVAAVMRLRPCTGALCAAPPGTEALGTPGVSRLGVPGRISAWLGPCGSQSLALSYPPPATPKATLWYRRDAARCYKPRAKVLMEP